MLHRILSVTFDNDMGSANHMEVGKSINADTFFTKPYTHNDKGTDENRIGQNRNFIFKNT